MLKFGVISDVNTETGLVRVNFAEDSFVSNWIPFMQPKTLQDEYFVMPDIDDHVAVMMDEHCENGVVMGSIFSTAKKPSIGGADKSYVKYKDGTTVIYDRSASKLEIKIGTATYTLKESSFEAIVNTASYKLEADGHTIKSGSETLKKILSDTLDALVALTVTCASPGSPSSPPVNLAQFSLIKARLTNFLK